MTTDQLRDRLTGLTVGATDPLFLNGRYLVESGNVCRPLLCDKDGHWTLPVDLGDVDGRVAEERLPSRLVSAALMSIAAEARAAGATELAGVSPLVPSRLRLVHIQTPDSDIHRAMPDLRHAVSRPHERLDHRSEVTPTGRVRRLDRKAPAYLAAHSEDWGRVTPSGVQPTRVLAARTERHLDIYENSVLAECIESSYRHVRVRQHETRQVQSFFEVLEGMLDSLEKVEWRSAGGLYELLGEAFVAFDDNTSEEVGALLDELHRLLGALRASSTVKTVRPLGRRELHLTNLLRDDHRYRTAHGLLLSLRSATDRSDEPEVSADGGLLADVVSYVVVVVARAFAALEINAVHGTAAPNSGVRFEWGWEVAWMTDHTVEIRRHGETQLRIVPLPHSLDQEIPADLIQSMSHPAMDRSRTLLAYLPEGSGSAGSPPWQLSALPHDQLRVGLPGVVPISPLDPRSVLRMTRELRWLVLSEAFAGYGAHLRCRPSTIQALDRLGAEWFEARSKFEFAVASEPTEAHIAAVVEHLSDPDRGFRRSHTDVDSVDEVIDRIQQQRRAINRLRVCPACTFPDGRFEARDGLTFWCDCQACGTEWGLRSCPNGHRIPVILPGGVEPSSTASGDDVLAAFGSYALATPCAGTSDIHWFVCPECRECPADAAVSRKCRRCSEIP
jgi:hypothetical protein